MKRISLFLFFLCALVLVGCGQSYPFSGTYTEEGTGYTYEFNNSKQFLINPNQEEELAIGGSFTWEKDSNEIVLTIDPPEGERITRTVTFTLDEESGTFTLTDEDGNVSVLNKKS